MFGSKDLNRNFFWIGFVILCSVFGVVVNHAGVVETQCIVSLRDTDSDPSLRQTLRRIYTAEIGVREKTGHNDGARVQEYLRYVKLQGNFSYCAAFACWAMGQAGIDNPKNGWAPALFPVKRVTWTRGQHSTVMPGVAEASHKKGGPDNETRSTPLRSAQGDVHVGDVFGIYFSELKRIAHCGFVDEWDNTWCITVEANTNDVGSVISENDPSNPIRAGPGEGVYRKKRLVRTIYKVADWISKY